MSAYVKLGILGLALILFLAIGYFVSAVHSAGYASGYSAGHAEGKKAGDKEGYTRGLKDKEAEIASKIELANKAAADELKKKQEKIDSASAALEEMRKNRDFYKNKLDNQIPKVNTVYITKTVEGQYEEKPTPTPIYTADFVRLWNQAIFGDSGVSYNSGESDGYSPGWRGIDGRTPMTLSSQDILQNHADNMKICMDTRDQLVSLQTALKESGLGIK